MSPAQIERLLKRRVEERLSGNGGLGLSGLCVEGVLGETDNLKRYGRRIYGASLTDGAEGGARLELSVPGALEEELIELEYCRVVAAGDLEARIYRSTFRFQLNVSSLKPAEGEDPSGEQLQADKSLAAVLRGYRRRARPFPAPGSGKEPVRILVLHPATGVTLRDFDEGLGDAPVIISGRPVATNDARVIRQAVDEARRASQPASQPRQNQSGDNYHDVLVMVRGGGPQEDLLPFNDPALAETWMNHPAYTISAVGHAQDATVLDALSDAACPTPTAAGAFVAQKVSEAARNAQHTRQAERYEAELRELAAARNAARSKLAKARTVAIVLAAVLAVAVIILISVL